MPVMLNPKSFYTFVLHLHSDFGPNWPVLGGFEISQEWISPSVAGLGVIGR